MKLIGYYEYWYVVILIFVLWFARARFGDNCVCTYTDELCVPIMILSPIWKKCFFWDVLLHKVYTV